VRVLGVQVDPTPEATRALRVLTNRAPDDTDCHFAAFAVAGDDTSDVTPFPREEDKAVLRFGPWDAAEGDVIVVMSTTPSACSSTIAVRDAEFCFLSEDCGSANYHGCEDDLGYYTASLPTCSTTVPTMNCVEDQGVPRCVEQSTPFECPTDCSCALEAQPTVYPACPTLPVPGCVCPP